MQDVLYHRQLYTQILAKFDCSSRIYEVYSGESDSGQFSQPVSIFVGQSSFRYHTSEVWDNRTFQPTHCHVQGSR